MDEKIRVLITDDSPAAQDNLREMLRPERDILVVGVAETGQTAINLVASLHPDVVLMDISLPDTDGLSATESLLSLHPGVGVIILSIEGEPDQLRQAMLAGASDYLTRPVGRDELTRSIRTIYKRESQRRQLAPRQVARQPEPDPVDSGTIIAVFSPKGGTGKTTIAVNLAAALKITTQKKVALVDGNLVFGDVGVLMNLTGTKSIMDLLPRIDEVDADLLDDVMLEHHSGVRVLLAPSRPELAELVGADRVRSLLGKLRESFDYVVVDTQSSFDEATLTMLDSADRIVVVVTLEVTALKNLKLFLDMAEALGYPRRKLMLAVNRGDNITGIGVREVEEKVRLKVSANIANDWKASILSTNRGIPMVISNRDSQIAKDIVALAQLISSAGDGLGEPVRTVEKSRGSIGGFIFHRR